MRCIIGAALLMALVGYAGAAEERKENPCGELRANVGPFDYRDGDVNGRLEIVERFHYTKRVENNVSGVSGLLGADLNYTLMVFPNHVPALQTLMRQAALERRIVVAGMQFPVECYYDRALRFRPDDPGVRTVYGQYLTGKGKLDRAMEMFRSALELKPEDATTNYNMGLAAFRAKDYDNANKYAHKAYQLGFPLPGLKNMLVEAGKWQEQEP